LTSGGLLKKAELAAKQVALLGEIVSTVFHFLPQVWTGFRHEIRVLESPQSLLQVPLKFRVLFFE
jgi:hypothetical protein